MCRAGCGVRGIRCPGCPSASSGSSEQCRRVPARSQRRLRGPGTAGCCPGRRLRGPRAAGSSGGVRRCGSGRLRGPPAAGTPAAAGASAAAGLSPVRRRSPLRLRLRGGGWRRSPLRSGAGARRADGGAPAAGWRGLRGPGRAPAAGVAAGTPQRLRGRRGLRAGRTPRGHVWAPRRAAWGTLRRWWRRRLRGTAAWWIRGPWRIWRRPRWVRRPACCALMLLGGNVPAKGRICPLLNVVVAPWLLRVVCTKQ